MTTHKQLKKQAQALSPTVMIGNKGLTLGVQNEIGLALDIHELIKIRINASNKAERHDMTHAICDEQKAELIQEIGHIIVIYRKSEQASERH